MIVKGSFEEWCSLIHSVVANMIERAKIDGENKG
jgi:hypothetical protein